MTPSKTGLILLALGILILLGVWFFAFQSLGLMALIIATIQGGFVLLGLFLFLVGLFMLLL